MFTLSFKAKLKHEALEKLEVIYNNKIEVLLNEDAFNNASKVNSLKEDISIKSFGDF